MKETQPWFLGIGIDPDKVDSYTVPDNELRDWELRLRRYAERHPRRIDLMLEGMEDDNPSKIGWVFCSSVALAAIGLSIAVSGIKHALITVRKMLHSRRRVSSPVQQPVGEVRRRTQ